MKKQDQKSTRFIPPWWKYYNQAETIYQIHSPFLFEFATHVWPSVSDIISDQRSQKTNCSQSSKRSPTLAWLQSLCAYYRINQLFMHNDNDISNQLFENFKKTSDSAMNAGQPDSFSLYETVEPHLPNQLHRKGKSVHILGILPPDEKDSDDMRSFILHSDSGIILCENIHSDDQHYKRWNQIIATGVFDYSVELYNFGILL